MLRSSIAAAVITFMPAAVSAQSLAEVCLTLANSGLQDTRQSSAVIDTFLTEFRALCSSSESRSERLKDASGGFKVSFAGFKLGGSGGGGTQLSEEEIASRCESGEQAYASHIRTSDQVSIGSYVANSIVECARVLADSKRETVFGLVRVDESDTGFDVNVYYTPGSTPLRYVFARTTTNRVTCYADVANSETAVGNVVLRPNSKNAFYCEKTAGEGALGSFVFEADVDGQKQTQTVAFDVTNRDRELEIIQAAERLVDDKIVPLTMEISELKEILGPVRERVSRLDDCYDDKWISATGRCIYNLLPDTRYTLNYGAAAALCSSQGARLCQLSEVRAAYNQGAEWCAWSWVADTVVQSHVRDVTGTIAYPMQTGSQGCTGGLNVQSGVNVLTMNAGATCCK